MVQPHQVMSCELVEAERAGNAASLVAVHVTCLSPSSFHVVKKHSAALQVLLSGAELGCSQEVLTVVALASSDPIYFAPRYAVTAVALSKVCQGIQSVSGSLIWSLQEQAGWRCTGMEALRFPDRGPYHEAQCIQELHGGTIPNCLSDRSAASGHPVYALLWETRRRAMCKQSSFGTAPGCTGAGEKA